MRFRAALFLLPCIAFAQTPAPQFLSAQAPPDVDAALRARVTEFFQDFVDAKFRDAMNLVAEDTQEEYFVSEKKPLKAFTIKDVKYDAGFEKANVTLQVKRVWVIQTHPLDVETDMPTTWKLEKGKWVWTHEIASNAWLTPMAPSDVDAVKRAAKENAPGRPPQNITPDKIQSAANQIFQQTRIDKSDVTLALDKPSSGQIIFHNGAPGPVHLDLFQPQLPGLTIKTDHADVNAGEDAILQISFARPANASADGAPPNATTVRFVVEPFNQQFNINVNFAASQK